jgi:hypothetical protein
MIVSSEETWTCMGLLRSEPCGVQLNADTENLFGNLILCQDHFDTIYDEYDAACAAADAR